MFAANAHRIRPATDADAESLARLAMLGSQPPLAGRILVGEIGGAPAAALSLTDGRAVADPFRRTGTLRISLRLRAGATIAHEATPSLPARLLAAVAPAQRSRRATPAVA